MDRAHLPVRTAWPDSRGSKRSARHRTGRCAAGTGYGSYGQARPGCEPAQRPIWNRCVILVSDQPPNPIDVDVATLAHEARELAHHNLFLRLFQGSAVKANEATSLEEAISTVLNYLCTELGWPVGHAYLPTASGRFISSDIWYLDHPESYEPFRAVRKSLVLKPEFGPAGKVLTTGKPAWMTEDLKNSPVAAVDFAVVSSCETGFAFPILGEGEIVAILELFTNQVVPVEAELLTVMEQVGLQVGLVLERFRVRSVLMAFAAELERSNQELDEFASVASHDLQEPLRKIQSFGDRLRTKHAHLLPEEGQLYLDRMTDSASRMQTLINDLLAYSRVTVKAKPFEPVNLQTLIDGVTGDLEDQIARTEGKVVVESLPVLFADPLQMHQLFQNLVSNAIKFHRVGVPPVVHISAEQSLMEVVHTHPVVRKKCWKITVTDNGIGFMEKHSARIFKMFERLHGRGVYEGTGIGLAICRKIVEHHGGTISGVGVPDEGSVFTIMLPIR